MKKRVFSCLLALLLALPCAALAAGRYEAVRLIVQEYTVEGGAVDAGGQATLRLKVRNTNAYAAAGNIVFFVEDPSGALIPQGPSGVYVREIGRGEETWIEFVLEAAADATPGYVKMTLHAEYETAEGAQESMQADVYVNVSQEVRLEHGAATLPVKSTEGDNLAFAMEFLNMGKGTIYNVLMAFDVPGLNGGSAVLVGNIEPGESKTGRANLQVSAPDGRYGKTSGTLTVSWEDASGQRWEKEIELSTQIMEKKAIVETKAVEKEEGGLPAWLPGVLIALAGVALVVCIQIGLEKRRERERDEKML